MSGTALSALVEQRVRLDDRLADFHRIAAELSATQLPASAVAAVQHLKAAIEQFDSDLTGLANATHDLVHRAQPSLAFDSPAPDIVQLMIVRAGGSRFALPVNTVREVRAWRGPLPSKGLRERELTLTALAVALDLVREPDSAADIDRKLLVLERPAGRALLVDEIMRQDELVVRPLGPLVPGPFTGAVTIAQDDLILVLDPAALAA